MRVDSLCRVSDVSSMIWYQLPSPIVSARPKSEARLPAAAGFPGLRQPVRELPPRCRTSPETRTRLECSRAAAGV